MTDQAKKQDASMDEILSSIRSIVNEEMDKKSGQVESDVLELTEEIDHDVPTADLGVTSAIADAPNHKVEDDLIDINAFSDGGVIQPADEESIAEARHHYDPQTMESTNSVIQTEEVDEAAAALDELNAVEEQTEVEVSAEDMAAEMMGTVSEESTMQEAESGDVSDAMAAAVEAMGVKDEAIDAVEEMSVEDIMAEEAMGMVESATLSDSDMDALMSEDTTEVSMDIDDDDLSSAATETLIQRAVAASEKEESVIERKAAELSTPTERVNLKAIPSANSSLQIGFPLEVLAEALRPLVKDWVEENLQEVVERLVREEIQKMTSRS